MKIVFAGLLVLFAATPVAAQTQSCSLPSLSWMAGAWLNADDPKGAREMWAVAPGDVLMGNAWEFPKDKTGYAEIMTIRADGTGISMFLRHFDGGLSRAWEERTAPMVFGAAHCEANSVTFDGQGDHAGEHMTYTRTGDTLSIVADFLHHGVPDHEEWRMVRAAE